MSGYVTQDEPRRILVKASTNFDRWVLRQLRNLVGDPGIRIELWDDHPSVQKRHSTCITFNDRMALYSCLFKPTYTFGMLYTSGRISLSGDPIEAMEAIYRGLERRSADRSRLARWLQRRSSVATYRQTTHRRWFQSPHRLPEQNPDRPTAPAIDASEEWSSGSCKSSPYSGPSPRRTRP